MRVNVAPLPGDGDGLRSRLQLQCADGQVLDVTHEEAMMSSTLWTLLQGAFLRSISLHFQPISAHFGPFPAFLPR